MTVIVVENVAPRLRGRLNVWMLEIRAGVYIGNLSQRHRAMVWSQVRNEIDNGDQGNAVLMWGAPNETGFDFDTHGPNRRIPREMDGIKFISFLPLEPQEDEIDISIQQSETTPD